MKIKTYHHGTIECDCDDHNPIENSCCKIPQIRDRFFGLIEDDGLTHSERMKPYYEQFNKWLEKKRGINE